MKSSLRITVGAAIIGALLAAATWAAEPTNPGEIDFGKFDPPSKGGQYVEVNIGNNLISMVAKLTEKQEPKIADVLKGLKSVRVYVIGLTDGNRDDIEKRVKTIRSDLDTKGWERIVTVQEDNEDVGVHVKTKGSEALEGLVVTVLDKKDAVFVNIVGSIRPEKVAMIGERFDIEPLKHMKLATKKQSN